MAYERPQNRLVEQVVAIVTTAIPSLQMTAKTADDHEPARISDGNPFGPGKLWEGVAGQLGMTCFWL